MGIIDLLSLHDKKDTEKSLVRANGGKELNEVFSDYLNLLTEKTKLSLNEINKRFFRVNINSLHNWRGKNKKYQNGHPIPLFALDKILTILNFKNTKEHVNLIKKIKILRCGRVSDEVNSPHKLDISFAKLCGAHAADGSLSFIKNRGPLSAVWDIGDQEKSNIEAVIEWIQKLFGIHLYMKRKGKMYYVRSSKQVITRYLLKIFDFPIGPKTNTVSIPKIFLGNDNRLLDKINSNELDALKLNFAKEVINFDGHSTKSGGVPSVGLGSNSRSLLEEIKEIFENYGIEFKIYDKKILTTSHKNFIKFNKFNIFRGNKRIKYKKLLKGISL